MQRNQHPELRNSYDVAPDALQLRCGKATASRQHFLYTYIFLGPIRLQGKITVMTKTSIKSNKGHRRIYEFMDARW